MSQIHDILVAFATAGGGVPELADVEMRTTVQNALRARPSLQVVWA